MTPALTFAAIEQVREAAWLLSANSDMRFGHQSDEAKAEITASLAALQALAEAAEPIEKDGGAASSEAWDAFYDALDRVRAGTQHPLGRDETGGAFEGEAP